MSYDWVKDINEMHAHYKMDISSFDKEKLLAFLEFRYAFLAEEMKELREALDRKDVEEIIDAHIDLNVVSTGTLDLLEINTYVAWDAVLAANMAKEPGVKPSRPNPLGLPDLIKPEGWVAPNHVGNYGLLTDGL